MDSWWPLGKFSVSAMGARLQGVRVERSKEQDRGDPAEWHKDTSGTIK